MTARNPRGIGWPAKHRRRVYRKHLPTYPTACLTCRLDLHTYEIRKRCIRAGHQLLRGYWLPAAMRGSAS